MCQTADALKFNACRAVMALIDDVVHEPDLTANPSASRSPDDDLVDPMDDGEAAGDSIDILGSLLTSNERFRRKINERHLMQDLQQVLLPMLVPPRSPFCLYD